MTFRATAPTLAGMNRPERVETPLPKADRDTHERIGYGRCEADQADKTLAELQKKRDLLARQIDAVEAENRNLERELLHKLGTWRKLDDATQRVDDVLPQLKAVTGSLTYRGVAKLLGAVNRARKVLRRRRK